MALQAQAIFIPHSSSQYISQEKEEFTNGGIAHYPNSVRLMVCQHG